MADEKTADAVPNRDLGDTSLDFSQPDGLPKPVQPKGPDGKFIKKEEAPPPPQHPSYLLEMARNYGFTEADCAKMTTDSLGVALTQAQRRDAQWQQRFQSQQPQAPQAAKPPEPEPEIDFGLNPEEYDEKVVGAFNKAKTLHTETQKELKALKQKLAETEERDRARSQAQAIQLVDDAFEALGPEYEEYFGKGSLSDIQAVDPKILRRRVIALQETGLDVGVASGKQLLSKLKKVADEVLGIKPKAKEPEPETPTRPGRHTKKEWSEGGTAVPTQRTSDQEPFGTERAVKNAERRAKENGQAVSPSTAKEDKELLNTFKRS